ncbi:MAG TPA: enolase C-terminal domain-like protein [Terriglobales bacterium]|jgi:muconate cycloisomerase|nr:enolase C-terminal domain-like protein [Terriglobales bacterium]
MKITSVEAIPVSQRVRPDLAIVSAAGKHPESHYLFVKIDTDDGVTGYGEATLAPVWSGESQAAAQHIICEILAPLLIGQNALHLNSLTDSMDRALIGNPFTKAAIEMALVDLVARIHQVPVYVLLGGPRRDPEIRLKFSIGAFSPKEAARVARHAVALGLSAVKVKVGFDVTQDIERVQAVRSEVGAEVRVAVDANAGWTENDAIRAIPYLERLNINALEQPLRRGDFRGCARLRRRTAIPIMLDESVFTRQDALEAIHCNACDLISIYPGKNGGIFRSLEIAQMAASAGMQCVLGSNLEMDLGTAAMLHLAIAVPALATTVDHDIIGPLYYERHFTHSPVRFRNGCAIAEERVGWGMSIDLSGTD